MANILQGLDAAMFNTPSDYIEAKDKYKADLQYKINDTWWMASDNFKIQIENVMGSRVFTDIICRVNHAIEPKTGLNLGDDFKELKFFDLDSANSSRWNTRDKDKASSCIAASAFLYLGVWNNASNNVYG